MKTLDNEGNPVDMTPEQEISVRWRGVYGHCHNVVSILEEGKIPPTKEDETSIIYCLKQVEVMFQELNALGVFEDNK